MNSTPFKTDISVSDLRNATGKEWLHPIKKITLYKVFDEHHLSILKTLQTEMTHALFHLGYQKNLF